MVDLSGTKLRQRPVDLSTASLQTLSLSNRFLPRFPLCRVSLKVLCLSASQTEELADSVSNMLQMGVEFGCTANGIGNE